MNQLNLFWETWLDVVGYEGLYQVNGRGDVKSLNYKHTGKEKIMRTWKNNGYLQLQLWKNGKYERFLVHRLVYEAFYGKIPEGMEIDHIDTIRDNNSVENLRCVTHKEQYSKNQNTKKRQEEVNKKTAQDPEWKKKHAELAKMKSIPVNQYTLDGEFIKTWPSAREIERELGFNNTNISKCCLGKYKQAYGSIWKYKQKDQAA